jgi:hypothetical protein
MASASLPSAIRAAAWIAGTALAASCNGAAHVSHGEGGGSTSASTGTPVPTGPHLVAPAVIDIPYVVAGQGGSTAQVTIANDGDQPLTGLAWMLSGDPSISLGAAPSSLAPGEQAVLSLAWSGSATEAIVQASLAVAMPNGEAIVPVFAVAGDPGLGTAAWDDVEGAGGVLAGAGITVAMPSAPFPDGVSKFTDPSVRVFLPEGYRDRGAHDLVLHFHGWNATLASTLATHLYQEHLYASGSNAVLIVPQGPVDAPSGDFGKLMGKGGVSRLLTEVLVLLYREGRITHPVRGDLVVTSHSGGYQAVAATLDPTNQAPKVVQIDLFDSLYGYEQAFETFALGGGLLRSNYTETGGTLDENQTVAAYLAQKGPKPASDPTQRALRDDPPVIDFAATTHDGTTRLEGAYGERLRWRLRHSRHGPRIELREVVAASGSITTTGGGPPFPPPQAIARWLAPADEDVTGFVVETSADGVTWTTAVTAAAGASDATFPLAAGARVRVKAVVDGIAPASALPSDTYRVDPGAQVLVVDGFDRVLDGSFGGLQHDFAALVGEAIGPVASISHRAVTEDGFDLNAWPAVVWLLGDVSTSDVSLSAAEQTALLDYVNGGGRLVMSGSELAFDIGQTPAGAMFLDQCFGAVYAADDAGSHEVAGQGPLASVASFAFGGAGAPYAAASPDALSAAPGGVVLLEYGSSKAAAVGRPGQGALAGFPLELIGSGPQLGAVMKALLAFVGGP